jgi:hypothetical protein
MVVPVPTAASSILATGFTANWTAPAIGTVTSYKLDVSTNNTFTSLVSGYNGLDCGNNLSQTVTGLTDGTTYYYRVRADKTSVTGTGGNYYTYTTATAISSYAIAPAGSGTAGDPYQIATLNNLYWLSTNSGAWNMNYIQTADINASQTRNWNSGSGFVPIGNTTTKFEGTYHGKGHIIDSLYINRPNDSYVGLFGRVWSSSTIAIDSLSLTNIYINGKVHVGGIVGWVKLAIIEHCSVSGNIVCSNSNSSAYGSGGLIGYCDNSNVNHCYSSVNVNCNNGSDPQYIGGLIGWNNSSVIKQCYSYGLVTASPSTVGAGGFIGLNNNTSTLDSCYWDNVTSGQTLGIYEDDQPINTDLHGKNTADMKTQSTYIGWDFNNIWSIYNDVNNGYPCFHYAPQVTTTSASNITNISATLYGNITRIGIYNPTSYGFCWNTSGLPSVNDSLVNLGATSTLADFSANAANLHHGTTYYVRAFAITQQDTVYGNQINFTTTNVTQANSCINSISNSVWVSIPDNSTLELTNNYTIEAWIKPVSFVNRPTMIVIKGTDGYCLRTSWAAGLGSLKGLNFDGMNTPDNILTLNQWYHVAAVNDNGTRHLYLNGVEQPLTGTPTTVVANNSPLIIRAQDGGSYSYQGSIEEVRLWNTALSYSQIRENIHLPLIGTETALVSYWQLDEGTDTIINDKKGINNGAIIKINGLTDNGWTTSTIPFGSGYSNTQVVTTTGTNNFTATGLTMDFTAKTGLDYIVISKIDTFPNVNPTGLNGVFDRQYWAVHKYGTGTFSANLTLTISEDFTADDQNIPTKIKLYKRSGMADDSTWVYVASAFSVNAATHQVVFKGVSETGQFILGRGACTVYVPDANFRAELLAIPGLDANSDGEIQCTEATAYTGDIDVNSKGIADMTGIEAFTNITKLYCKSNNLTSLNISTLTLLTDLDCSNNQLTTLDVSGNTALVNFNCGNNLLTSLDVSSLSSLNYLLCRYNQLTSLNVLSNSALIGLFCNNNLLTNLNVTGLTSLAQINSGVNQLTNLDFSSNTALIALDCSYNLLTNLNVKNGNNANIVGSDFSAASNASLTCIQVDDATWSTTNWTNKDAGASYNTSCGMVTETSGIGKTAWSVYPNPVSDILIIEAENLNENASFEIINSVGLVVSAGTLLAETSIQTSHFPMGIYLLKVGNGKTFEISKIVKK